MADSDPVTKKDLADFESRLEEKLIAKLVAIGDQLTEFGRNIETSLLTSFHGYGKVQAAKMTHLEVGESLIKRRLDALEERILNLETRRPH